MENDYIKREDALKALQNPEIFNVTPRLLQIIRELPAADVAPVVHARWEEADWREYDAQSCETICYPKAALACTNCRCAFKKDALWSRNYCPNCWAKMDGGEGREAD